MTESEKFKIMAMQQASKALAPAGIILIDEEGHQVLRRPQATGSSFYMIFFKPGSTSHYGFGSSLQHALRLRLCQAGFSHYQVVPAGLFGEGYTTWLSMSEGGINEDPNYDLCSAQKQMMEMNQSFNMQYLGLQQKMQDESRRFSLLSNIMKTKHDTAKNSIGNIR